MRQVLIRCTSRMALVDDEDFDKVTQYTWYLTSKTQTPQYAVTYEPKGLRMHQIILPPIPGFITLHGPGGSLDNRKSNLRYGTQLENMQEREMLCNNTSGVTGVSFDKSSGRWLVRISIMGKRIYVGSYLTKDAAIVARNKANQELH